MAARTNAADVSAILDATELTTTEITVYITSASALVDVVLGETVVTPISKEIERWLAAHMIASSRERMAQKEGTDDAYIEYVGRTYQGLYSTPYGQMVLTLDTTGKFAALDKKVASTYAVKS